MFEHDEVIISPRNEINTQDNMGGIFNVIRRTVTKEIMEQEDAEIFRILDQLSIAGDL